MVRSVVGDGIDFDQQLDGFAFDVLEVHPPLLPSLNQFFGLLLLIVGLVAMLLLLPPDVAGVPALGVLLLGGVAMKPARRKVRFTVDATGLVHDDVRYSWSDVGQPVVEVESLTLGNGKTFEWHPIRPDERNRLRRAFVEIVPKAAAEPTPAALAALLDAGRQKS